MNNYLKEKQKTSYYELCIINLIEKIKDIKELSEIKKYLIKVIHNAGISGSDKE